MQTFEHQQNMAQMIECHVCQVCVEKKKVVLSCKILQLKYYFQLPLMSFDILIPQFYSWLNLHLVLLIRNI